MALRPWRRTRWINALALLALLVAPWTASANTGSPAIRLISSATTVPFVHDLLPLLKAQHPLSLSLATAGSETAIDDVIGGRADAALISRPLTDDEARSLHATTIAVDALLLVANERNPLTTLDEQTVRSIFRRQISDWAQLSPGPGISGAIVPVTRGASHATRTLFDARFAIGRLVPTGIVELSSGLASVLYIGADPLAIGYMSAGTFEDARRHGLRIKLVPLTGAAPPKDDCPGAGHLLCRPLSLVYRHRAPSRGVRALESFLRGPDARALLELHGFVPVTPATSQ